MSTYIPDMALAIADGTMPGRFTTDRRVYRFPTLEYNTSRGAVHTWTISVRLLAGPKDVRIDDRWLSQPVADLPNMRAEIVVTSSLKGGKVRDVVPTYVAAGKNLGKKNATNALTQALRDALGLYNKQMKGHDISRIIIPVNDDTEDEDVATVEDVAAAEDVAAEDVAAEDAATEDAAVVTDDEAAIPGFAPRPPPMLVKKNGETKAATLTQADFTAGVTEQPKLDGIRCVTYFTQGRVVRYSRTGTLLPPRQLIETEILAFMDHLPTITAATYGVPATASATVLAAYAEGSPYFDGELYKHGVSLNKIVGQSRRGAEEKEIEYHVYDVFFPAAIAAGHNMPSRFRREYLAKCFAGVPAKDRPHIKEVPSYFPKSMQDVETMAQKFLHEKYEGAIVRKEDGIYMYGYSNYHSSELLKIKPKMTDEFKVVGFAQGVKGKDVGAVIWECVVDKPLDKNDAKFTVVPKSLTLPERKQIFKCLGELVTAEDGTQMTRFERDVAGLPLTVEYAGLSAKTGKPLQGKAVAFRTYESGPDPIQKLFEECGR